VVKRNATKNEEAIVVFFWTRMLQHTGQLLVRDFLAKNKVTMMEHPTFCLGLSPADLYLSLLL